MSVTDVDRDGILSYLLFEACEDYGRPVVRKKVSTAAFMLARREGITPEVAKQRSRSARDAVDALLAPSTESQLVRDVVPELLEVGDLMAAMCLDESLIQRWESIRETTLADAA